jgi:putative glutamine transport system permease protein
MTYEFSTRSGAGFHGDQYSISLSRFKLDTFYRLYFYLLSTILGTLLAVMRNGKNPFFKLIASVYIEVVRNVPNLLWIFVVFLIFQVKSVPAGIISFTVFTTAALAEIIRGGLNGVPEGQTEAGKSQGFSDAQILTYIVLPQAVRKMLPAIISQFVTVIKDTSFLYSVIALQELFGNSQILMGQYFQVGQVFMIYGFVALIYFVINFAISQLSRKLQKSWANSLE